MDTSFNVVARHRELGNDCALCGRGRGVHAAEDFVRLVVERRRVARFAPAMRDGCEAEDDR